jgi:transposase
MARRERRKFTDEYKAEVVALVRSSGKGIAAISRDLDLIETAVREWVQRADSDGPSEGRGRGPQVLFTGTIRRRRGLR